MSCRVLQRLSAPLLVGVLSATTAEAQRHLYTFNGLDSYLFGSSVSGAGDVNRDGFADLIVGAFWASRLAGHVRVLSGKDGRVLYSFSGSSAYDLLGLSVAGAGDVNKDGFPDLIFGVPGDDNNGNDSGSARVVSGKDGKTLYTFHGDSSGDGFGRSVAGAGDVNQDGHADLIVGSIGDDNNGAESGSARVLSGKDGKVLYTFNGDSAGDQLGIAVGGAGDVNNDGFSDLVIGANRDDNNGSDSGSARVLSGKDGKILYTFNGDLAGSFFGASVSGAGDVNKDGFADLIVGAIWGGGKVPNTGYARVFSGKDGKVLYTFNGDSTNDQFGSSVGSAGDVNKDGFTDLIVGAPFDANNGKDSGSARVLSGKDGKILFTFNGDSGGDLFGTSVAGAGDVNGDGFADLIVGAPWDDNTGGSSGSARVLSGKVLTLTADTHGLSRWNTHTQTLNLHAGPVNRGRFYWLFGSMTGTSPGVTLGAANGVITIPLNPDPWTDITIGLANSKALANTRGTLDVNGQAQAQIRGWPVWDSRLLGLIFYHAYVVYDAQNVYLASNPVPLKPGP